MAARLHPFPRGLKNLGKPPNLSYPQRRAFSSSRPPLPPPPAAARRPPTSLPYSALRSLAQHLVSSSKRFYSSQPAGRASLKHAHLPQDLASRVRVMNGKMPGFGGFHSSSAGRFGPGGLGRGPMGPSVRGAFSRGVGNVGLGGARGYASMSRPLLDGVFGNTPLALRALANGLEDQADNLKFSPRSSLHHGVTKSKKQRASASHSYLKNIKKVVPTTSGPIEEEPSASEDYSIFFSPSASHYLPSPTSPSSVTTLFLPFAINNLFPPTSSLSHLASSHRAAYQTHARRVDRLLTAMEHRGVFLDEGVREEEVKDWENEVLGVRIIFEGRSEEEVRAILVKQAGEGEWWYLDEHASIFSETAASTLVYPTIPLVAINSSSIFIAASSSILEEQFREEREEWAESTSSAAPSLSLNSSISSSNSTLSSTSDLGSSFPSDVDGDDADWFSEVSSSDHSSDRSASGSASMMLLAPEERTDLFSSAYWSEMGGESELVEGLR